jgi:hypothetical protein
VEFEFPPPPPHDASAKVAKVRNRAGAFSAQFVRFNATGLVVIRDFPQLIDAEDRRLDRYWFSRMSECHAARVGSMDHLWSSLTALIRARRGPCEILALTPHAPHPALLE